MSDFLSSWVFDFCRVSLFLVAVALTVGVALRCTRPTSPRLHRTAWCLVLLIGWLFVRIPVSVPWYESAPSEESVVDARPLEPKASDNVGDPVIEGFAIEDPAVEDPIIEAPSSPLVANDPVLENTTPSEEMGEVIEIYASTPTPNPHLEKEPIEPAAPLVVIETGEMRLTTESLTIDPRLETIETNETSDIAASQSTEVQEVSLTPVVPKPASAPPPVDRSASAPVDPSWLAMFISYWPAGLMIVWSVGIVIALLRWLAGYIRSIRNMSTALSPDKTSLRQWQELLRQHEVKQEIPLRLTKNMGPLLCRWLDGYELVVPKEFWESLSPSARLAVMRHELAHYRRGDVWKSLAMRILALPHWFNPAAWWAVRRFDEAAEWACDEAAIGTDERSTDYARTLLVLAESSLGGGSCHPSMSSWNLPARIRRLVTSSNRKDSLMKKTILLTMAMLLFAICLVRIDLVAKPPTAVEPTKTTTETTTETLITNPLDDEPVLELEVETDLPSLELVTEEAVEISEDLPATDPFEPAEEIVPPKKDEGEKKSTSKKASRIQLRYDGKTFDEWKEVATKTKDFNQADMVKAIEVVKAFTAFGIRKRGREATEQILLLARKYESAFLISIQLSPSMSQSVSVTPNFIRPPSPIPARSVKGMVETPFVQAVELAFWNPKGNAIASKESLPVFAREIKEGNEGSRNLVLMILSKMSKMILSKMSKANPLRLESRTEIVSALAKFISIQKDKEEDFTPFFEMLMKFNPSSKVTSTMLHEMVDKNKSLPSQFLRKALNIELASWNRQPNKDPANSRKISTGYQGLLIVVDEYLSDDEPTLREPAMLYLARVVREVSHPEVQPSPSKYPIVTITELPGKSLLRDTRNLVQQLTFRLIVSYSNADLKRRSQVVEMLCRSGAPALSVKNTIEKVAASKPRPGYSSEKPYDPAIVTAAKEMLKEIPKYAKSPTYGRPYTASTYGRSPYGYQEAVSLPAPKQSRPSRSAPSTHQTKTKRSVYQSDQFPWTAVKEPTVRDAQVPRSRYNGKTFDEWKASLKDEVNPTQLASAIQALTALGVQERRNQEAADLIMQIIRGHKPMKVFMALQMASVRSDDRYLPVGKKAVRVFSDMTRYYQHEYPPETPTIPYKIAVPVLCRELEAKQSNKTSREFAFYMLERMYNGFSSNLPKDQKSSVQKQIASALVKFAKGDVSKEVKSRVSKILSKEKAKKTHAKKLVTTRAKSQKSSTPKTEAVHAKIKQNQAQATAEVTFSGVSAFQSNAQVSASAESTVKKISSNPERAKLRYKGKPFGDWMYVLLTDLSVDSRVEAVKALAAFGARGYGKEAAETITKLMRQYGSLVIDGTDRTNLLAASVAAFTGQESKIIVAQTIPIADGMPVLCRELKEGNKKSQIFVLWVLNGLKAKAKDATPALAEFIQNYKEDRKEKFSQRDRAFSILLQTDPTGQVVSDVLRREFEKDLSKYPHSFVGRVTQLSNRGVYYRRVYYTTPGMRGAVETLTLYLNHPTALIRHQAMFDLARFLRNADNPETMPSFVSIVGSPPPSKEQSQFCTRMMGHLIAAYEKADPEHRQKALKILKTYAPRNSNVCIMAEKIFKESQKAASEKPSDTALAEREKTTEKFYQALVGRPSKKKSSKKKTTKKPATLQAVKKSSKPKLVEYPAAIPKDGLQIFTTLGSPKIDVSIAGKSSNSEYRDDQVVFRIVVKNRTAHSMDKVKVEVIASKTLKITAASKGYNLENKRPTWTIDSLKPGITKYFEVQCKNILPGEAVLTVKASSPTWKSLGGCRGESSHRFEIKLRAEPAGKLVPLEGTGTDIVLPGLDNPWPIAPLAAPSGRSINQPSSIPPRKSSPPLSKSVKSKTKTTSANKRLMPSYRIEPPDVLRIELNKIVPKASYRLDAYDVLQINTINTLLNHPINNYFLIAAEGDISLGPAYGKVKVGGMTVDEAEKAVVEHLQTILRDPKASVSLERASGMLPIKGDYLVGPDGTITLKRYGSIHVTGKTVHEAAVLIQKHLAKHLQSPQVSVDVGSYNSKHYYLITNENQQSNIRRLPLTGNETVLDTIAQSPSLDPSKVKIQIARPGADGTTAGQILDVDWNKMKTGHIKSNYQILPGDRVLILFDVEPNSATDPKQPHEGAMISLSSYRIEPPDLIQIDIVKMVPLKYRLGSEDILQIDAINTLLNHPINSQYKIDAQGRVSLGPAYGKVKVAGMTIEEAEKAVLKHLKTILKGPEVSIQIARTSDLQLVTGTYLIGPDGTVNLRTYGSVHVSGKTIAEAKKLIEEKLSGFLKDPEVSVMMAAYNSKVYYVITNDNDLGDNVVTIPITGRDTVLDALSKVQGVGDLSIRSIWVSRPPKKGAGKSTKLSVDYNAIITGKDTKTNYQMFPGDRVYISKQESTPHR